MQTVPRLRRLVLTFLLVVAAVAVAAPARAAPVRSRILYVGDWTGQTQVFAAYPSGAAPTGQLTRWQPGCDPRPDLVKEKRTINLLPSPNGRYLALRCGTALWLMRANGSAPRQVVAPRGSHPDRGGVLGDAAWSRDSRSLAYALDDGIHVLDVPRGSDRRAGPRLEGDVGWSRDGRSLFVVTKDALYRLRNGGVAAQYPRGAEAMSVSPDGRWIATVTIGYAVGANSRVTIVRSADGKLLREFPGVAAAWSPDGRRLAIESRVGIDVFEMRSRRLRTLTTDVGFGPPPQYARERGFGVAWSPDGRSVAYIGGNETIAGAGWGLVSGDLKTVTLAGKTRTVVPADHAYGGRMTALAWTTSPRSTHYPDAEAAPRDRVSSDGLLADGDIEFLTADGPRVAFETCNRIVVWTPSTGDVDPAPEVPTSCFFPDVTGHVFIYDLALAGDRVLYTRNVGCMSITLELHLARLGPSRSDSVIAKGGGNCAYPFPTAVGRLAGGGGLLVFDQWSERGSPGDTFEKFVTTHAAVRRVEPTGCPCPVLAETPGFLYTADVNGDRIVVYGDNETDVLDRDGNRLLSLPVSPAAAQLTGTDLVLLVQGQLRDYDTRSGALLHAWPLPDVPSGPVCAWRVCERKRLVLDDAAPGMVAYTLDGELHLLRLASGRDAVIGPAKLARFMDSGLVYANGSRLHLVPYTALPKT